MLPSAPRACARGASPPGAPSTQRQTGAAPSRNWWSRTSGQHLRYRRPGSLVRVLRTRHHADPAGGVAWLPVGRVGLRPQPESAGLSRPASILRRRSTSTRACGTRCRTTGTSSAASAAAWSGRSASTLLNWRPTSAGAIPWSVRPRSPGSAANDRRSVLLLKGSARESGGIGRRAGLRSRWPKGCKGSSPFFRTSL